MEVTWKAAQGHTDSVDIFAVFPLDEALHRLRVSVGRRVIPYNNIVFICGLVQSGGGTEIGPGKYQWR
jgi:hypothetical protein